MTVINTNIKALVAGDSLRANQTVLSQAMERLSTGKRINGASDDAAGLAIATKMTTQVRGLSMAIKNANDGIALVQTAEGAMNEVSDMLQRMRELTIQSGNSTSSDGDRAASQLEIGQLKSEIDRIATTTQYNNMNVTDGSFQAKTLQIGANSAQTMSIGIHSVDTTTLGEKADGPAIQAARAKLAVTGMSTNAADYQGKTFNVNVNGVAKTVSLPESTITPLSAANVVAQPVGVDRSTAASFVLSDTSIDPGTIDMDTTATRGFDISVGAGTYHSIDITAAMASYYEVNTAAINDPTLDAKSKSDEVTATAFTAIVQKAIDDSGLFTGANKVTVNVDTRGYVSMTSAGGQAVNLRDGVSITDGTTATTFVNTFISTSAPAGTLDFSDNDNTEFKIDVNNSGVDTQINLRTYLDDTAFVKTRSAVTKAELVNVLNTAVRDAGFTGNNEVNFSIDQEGRVSVYVPKGLGQIDFTEATLTDGSGATGTFATQFMDSATASFDRLATATTQDLSDVLDFGTPFQDNDFAMSVSVNGSDFVSIDMTDYIKANAVDTTQVTGHDMAAALQAAFNAHFSGSNAVTVQLNGDGNLEFHTVGNEGIIKMKEGDFNGSGTDGTFVTTYIDAGAELTINFNDDPGNTVTAGDIDWEATSGGTPAQVFLDTFSYAEAAAGNRVSAFTEVATTLAAAQTLEVELDGHDSVVLNLTAGTYNTLDSLAASINLTIKASGAFEGENALTARVYRGTDVADPSTAVQYLVLENAGGKKITLVTDSASLFGAEDDSFVDDAAILSNLGIVPNTSTDYDTSGRMAGGVNTTANNGVVSIQVVSGNTTISKQVQLSVKNANTSFSDFAAQMTSDANTAFAGTGVSFVGSYQNGQLSFGLASAGDKTLTLSGSIVEDAFGSDKTARGSNGDYRKFTSLADVASEINKDLTTAGGATASYDASSNSLVFEATTGVVGHDSVISLSGAALAGLGITGTPSAVGVDSNATASKLSEIDITTIQGASDALKSLDNALSYVSLERAYLGAIQNRLTHTVNNLSNIVVNTQDSRSRIEDADYSQETTKLAKSQILTQAATAMLAQANQSAQTVLSLLK